MGYITALSRAVRDSGGFGVVEERRRCLMPLARQAWEEVGPYLGDQEEQWLIGVAATFRLCALSGDLAALAWAECLWSRSLRSGLRSEMMALSFVPLMESFRLHERVDALLREGGDAWVRPNSVLLGGLVNVAAEHRDLERGEIVAHVGRRLGCAAKQHCFWVSGEGPRLVR